MKNLHKKMSVVALVAIALSGGILSSGLNIYANNSSSIEKVSWEELGKYGNFDCPKFPEVPRRYIYNPRDVLVKGDNIGIERLEDSLKNNNFSGIRVSGVPGEINDSLSDLRSVLDNEDVEKLKVSKLCFKDINRFNEFMEEVKRENIYIPDGFYRFMIGGFDGIYYYKFPKKREMFDEDEIALRYIMRSQKEYQYEILRSNLEGKKYYKEYDDPMVFYDVDDFLRKVKPGVREKYRVKASALYSFSRHSVHGGMHKGGIYSARIGNLIFLFRAL